MGLSLGRDKVSQGKVGSRNTRGQRVLSVHLTHSLRVQFLDIKNYLLTNKKSLCPI